MSVETVTAFAGLSVFGVLFGILIPDNSCKNALKVLLSLIITAALLNVISGMDVLKNIDRYAENSSYGVSADETYSSAGRIVGELTESEIKALVEGFTGKLPKTVICQVAWDGEDFVLSSVRITCECDNPEGVAKYVAAKLGISPSVIDVIAVKGE